MKMNLMSAAVAAIVLGVAASAQAQLLYNFETPVGNNPDGFAANGGGVTIGQTTAGATLGTYALNYSVVQGATFVGALTSTVPAALSSPLPIEQLKFDYTIPTAFSGAFASLGVTIYGASQPSYPGGQLFGLSAQFSDFEPLEGKAAGTYTATIDLTNATNQIDFSTGSFNQIFGSGATQQIPTGFQFFLNKSGDAPINFQIDNVRLTSTQAPEPASMLILGSIASFGLGRRRRSL